jgi:hypothetical protein
MNLRAARIVIVCISGLLAGSYSCKKQESPVVTQARANMRLAEQDVERARRDVQGLEAELQTAQEAATQADQDPALQSARQAVATAQRTLDENNYRYNHGDATHERIMRSVSLGGQLTVARNALGAAERSLRAARQRTQEVEGRLRHAQDILRSQETELVRRQQMLVAAEQAAQ